MIHEFLVSPCIYPLVANWKQQLMLCAHELQQLASTANATTITTQPAGCQECFDQKTFFFCHDSCQLHPSRHHAYIHPGTQVSSRVHPIPPATLAAAPARKETSTGADVYLYDMYIYIYIVKKEYCSPQNDRKTMKHIYVFKVSLVYLFCGCYSSTWGSKGRYIFFKTIIVIATISSHSHGYITTDLWNCIFPAEITLKIHCQLSIMTDR